MRERTVAALAANTGGTEAIWLSAGIGNETHGQVGTLKAAH